MNIKLIIFDLDGVLIETKKLHYEALNKALKDIHPKYIIDESEHLSKYDGLSTNKKLTLLTKEKNLSAEYYKQVWESKQKYTLEELKKINPDNRIKEIIKKLKQDKYIVAVASNSIKETVKITLLRLELLEYIDFFLSNQDVKNPKN
jgi:beta-phosphoglucomutase-like phosphatase (HAD superfamily)